MKKFFETLLYLILAVLAAGILLIVFLTVSEYRPADVEPVPVSGKAEEKQIPLEEPIEVISWNVGYAALGKDADFVMDGGIPFNFMAAVTICSDFGTQKKSLTVPLFPHLFAMK